MELLKKIKKELKEICLIIASIFKVEDKNYKGFWIYLNRLFIGVYIALLFFVAYKVELGFGNGIDYGIVFLAGIGALVIGKLAFAFILFILKKIPLKFLINFIVVILIVAYALDESLAIDFNQSIIMAAIILMPQILIIYALVSRKKKYISILLILICLTVDVGYVAFLYNDENKDDSVKYSEEVFNEYGASVEDPSANGEYTVKSLTYGSGNHKTRAEYGAEVDIKTDPISAGSFMWSLDGLNKYVREKYWGFSWSQVPLNGVVYYPEEDGTYPLVLIIHGNHDMLESSDMGYAYLGEMLASKGYIVASIDQNFINGSWSGGAAGGNDARAWHLLKNLELWHEWNEDPGSEFYKKIDTDNIGLIGHSRGGEAVALAALFNELDYYPGNSDIGFNFGYNIKSVVAIAPTDGQYKPGGKYAAPENIDYLMIQGSSDGDVDEILGIKMFDRIKFTDEDYHMKTALYIDGANHGKFNSTWIDDKGFPDNLFINDEGIISTEEQQQIAKVYIGAFLDYSIKGKSEYLDIFKNYTYALPWIPHIKYMNRFQDSNYEVLANFDEDFDMRTMTLEDGLIEEQGISFWREREIRLRDGENTYNSAAYVKWRNDGRDDDYESYLEFMLPEDFSSANYEALAFDIGDSAKTENDEEDVSFKIRVEDENGNIATVSNEEYATLWKAFSTEFTKIPWLEQWYDEYDTVQQSYFIPFDDFKSKNKDIDMNNIKKMYIVFGNTDGEVLIDNVSMVKK